MFVGTSAVLFLSFSAVEEVVERHPVGQNLRFDVEPWNDQRPNMAGEMGRIADWISSSQLVSMDKLLIKDKREGVV